MNPPVGELWETPLADDAFVLELANEKNAAIIKVRIEVQPFSARQQCFHNVLAMIQRNGGGAAIGWSVAMMNKQQYYLTHHVLWVSEDQSLTLDVTEPAFSTQNQSESLFLWDGRLGYDGGFLPVQMFEKPNSKSHQNLYARCPKT